MVVILFSSCCQKNYFFITFISVVNQPLLLRQRCGNLCQLNKKTKSWNFLDLVTSEVTFFKSFSVRKLLDQSAFAYLVLLGPSGSFCVLLCPSGFFCVILCTSVSFWVFLDSSSIFCICSLTI